MNERKLRRLFARHSTGRQVEVPTDTDRDRRHIPASSTSRGNLIVVASAAADGIVQLSCQGAHRERHRVGVDREPPWQAGVKVRSGDRDTTNWRTQPRVLL